MQHAHVIFQLGSNPAQKQVSHSESLVIIIAHLCSFSDMFEKPHEADGESAELCIPENLKDGMVLVVDYWQSQSLNWLDGVGCGYGKEYCTMS